MEEAALGSNTVQGPKQEELLDDPEDTFFTMHRNHYGVTHTDRARSDIRSSQRKWTPTETQDLGNDGTKNVCGICGKM